MSDGAARSEADPANGSRASELRISGSPADALTAIREALPEDAVVRGEDDAVGRFASERTVMIIAQGERRLMLYQGNWRRVKAREGQPQLDVELLDAPGGTQVRLTSAPPETMGVGARIVDGASNAATVGLVVVAYHLFRDLPLDYGVVAAIAVGGGLAWSLIAHLWPSPQDAGLEGLVRGALAPMVAGSSEDPPGVESG